MAGRLTHDGKTINGALSGGFVGDYNQALTLKQSAQALNIDLKTLSRRMALAGVEPARGGHDRRARLLSPQQLLLLTPQSAPNWSAQVAQMLEARERQLTEGAAMMEQREKELEAHLNRFEALVATITSELAPKIEQLLAQSGVQPDGPEAETSSDPQQVSAQPRD